MSTPTFTASKVEMSDVPLEGPAAEVKRRYEEIYGVEPETRNGWFHPADWPRAGYVLSRMDPGDRVLDVGVGAGQFLNMVALSDRYTLVAGIDQARFAKYVELSPLIERTDGSIAELPYPDDSFDVVSCMEVLEHLPEEIFETGLAELRRVCRGQLLMTVPFEEPEPLSKTHLRRFDRSDVARVFPDGRFTILNRKRMPWVLIEERLDGSPFAHRDEPSFDAPHVTPQARTTKATAAESTLSPEQRQIRRLEEKVAALKARRSVRAADWAGRQARRIVRRAKEARG